MRNPVTATTSILDTITIPSRLMNQVPPLRCFRFLVLIFRSCQGVYEFRCYAEKFSVKSERAVLHFTLGKTLAASYDHSSDPASQASSGTAVPPTTTPSTSTPQPSSLAVPAPECYIDQDTTSQGRPCLLITLEHARDVDPAIKIYYKIKSKEYDVF
jgi:hypothetical protein